VLCHFWSDTLCVIDAGNNMIGFNFLFPLSVLSLFYFPSLNLSNASIFLHWKNIFLFLSIHSIYFFSFHNFLISFVPRLVAGSKFLLCLLLGADSYNEHMLHKETGPRRRCKEFTLEVEKGRECKNYAKKIDLLSEFKSKSSTFWVK
jgi:hypothetical protein